MQLLQCRRDQAVQDRVGGRDAHRARHRSGPSCAADRADSRWASICSAWPGQDLRLFRRQVPRARTLEQGLAQTTLDALYRAKHRGRVHAQALAGGGKRPESRQGKHHLQVGGVQPVLRARRHGLRVCLFSLRCCNPRLLPLSTQWRTAMDPRNTSEAPAYGVALLRISLGIMWVAHALLKLLVFTLPGTAAYFASVGLPGRARLPGFLRRAGRRGGADPRHLCTAGVAGARADHGSGRVGALSRTAGSTPARTVAGSTRCS